MLLSILRIRRELRRKQLVTAFLISGVLMACGRSATTRTTAEGNAPLAAVADSILPLVVMYKAAWEQRSPELISQFHGDDFEFYWNGTRLGDIEDALRQNAFTGLEEYAIDMVDPVVEVVGPNEGAVSFRYRHWEVSSTGAVRESEGTMKAVFERQDRMWKIIRIQQSGPVFLLPMPGTEQTAAARDTLPLGGLHYVGPEGYVGHWLVAELENDEEVCPRPWLATPRAIEGDLPSGLSFSLTDGRIEGTPREAGMWTVQVILDEVTCADRALDSVTVPVSFTIHE